MPVSHLQSLQDTLARLEKTTSVLDRFAQDMERTRVPIEIHQTVARQVLDEMRPMVKGIILANYAASGIKDHTNKLRDAIGQCVVGGSFNPGRPWKLWVMLPANVSPYVYTPHPLPGHKPGKQRSSNFYQVAMTLTHGGVIPVKRGTINTLNKKGRRSLKTSVLQKGGTGAKRGGVAYRVIKPRYAFYLSPGQKAELSEVFVQKYTTKMRNVFHG